MELILNGYKEITRLILLKVPSLHEFGALMCSAKGFSTSLFPEDMDFIQRRFLQEEVNDFKYLKHNIIN